MCEERETGMTATDPLSKQGAEALAQRLRNYWHARGCNVAVRAIQETCQGKRDRDEIWIVRSDLIAGLSRDKIAKANKKAAPSGCRERRLFKSVE